MCGRMNFLVLAILDIGNEIVVLAEKRGEFFLREMELTPESLELSREFYVFTHVSSSSSGQGRIQFAQIGPSP
jgi:hypothetical protein